MDNSPSFPNSYERLDQSDARNETVDSTQVFELRALASQATLTAFETPNGAWICCIEYFCGDTEYYQMAKNGSPESVLSPLLLEDWTIESYDIDRLIDTLRCNQYD